MNRILIGLSLLAATAISSLASNVYDDLEVLRAQLLADRKAVVADTLELSTEESAAFWPVWEHYQEKVNEVRRVRMNLVLEFLEKREAMSDEEAMSLLKRHVEVKRSFADLEAKWLGKFHEVLPARKVARYYQIENKIDALINFELAAQVPLTR